MIKYLNNRVATISSKVRQLWLLDTKGNKLDWDELEIDETEAAITISISDTVDLVAIAKHFTGMIVFNSPLDIKMFATDGSIKNLEARGLYGERIEFNRVIPKEYSKVNFKSGFKLDPEDVKSLTNLLQTYGKSEVIEQINRT